MVPGDDEIADELAATKPGRDLVAEHLRSVVRRRLLDTSQRMTIGRFAILERVGGGAMGVVFGAYDPTLDRRVALKVLRARGEEARHRWLREAQALARVSHPNVVAVYDVGELGDEVYIAMEFVGAPTLRAWIEQQHSLEEKLRVLAAAGRGLAAAHAAGIIHGDFKPENVLVDERVRVVDFGLARSDQEAAGERGGTLPYLSPEQWAGQPSSALSDQFAFSVVLYEALAGARPFEGETALELRRTVSSTEARMPEVPAWLARVLRRGLARDPAQRFAHMLALVEALSRGSARRKRVWLLGGLTLATLAAAAIGGMLAKERDRCGGGDSRLAAVWSPQGRERVRRSLGGAYAGPVLAALDERGRAWRSMSRSACEATWVRGDQTLGLLDLRRQCLDRRLSEMASLIAALGSSQNERQRSASLEAVDGLPEIERCADVAALTADEPLPEQAQRRARVVALLEEVERGWAQFALGNYGSALAIAEKAASTARPLAHPTATARALLLLGSTLGRIGKGEAATEHLFAALDQAALARSDRLLAEIASRLVASRLFDSRLDEMRSWARFAGAAALRGRVSQADLESMLGEALLDEGRFDEAIQQLKKARQAQRERRPAKPASLALATTLLGNATLERGDAAHARELYQEALAIARSHFGEQHPSLARYVDNLGRGLLASGKPAEALATHRRALAMRRAAFGEEDRAVATTWIHLGDAALALADRNLARSSYERALRIRRAQYGAAHPRLAPALSSLGRVALEEGDRETARRFFSEALALRRKATPHHPEVRALETQLQRLHAIDRP